MLSMLLKIFRQYFEFLPQKISWHFMQIVSFANCLQGDNLHEMSVYFLEKKIKMLSTEMFTQHA